MNQATMRIEEYQNEPTFHATLVSSEPITPETSEVEVRELTLDVEQPEMLFAPGQSVCVFAPGDPALGEKQHLRLYSVADLPERSPGGKPRIKLCVRRCSYVDEYSGERYPGIASNYLCDLRPGAEIELAGPFGLPFSVPPDHDAHLILIGTGTGIAPFRALVKHLYLDVTDWKGKVWLFYGARNGLELLYMNDRRDDFALYYDQQTFEAFRALSPRPHWADPIGWDYAIGARAEELWTLLGKPKTYVYVAGLEPMRDELDRVFAGIAGSNETWRRRKSDMMAGGRWVELLY